MLHFRFLFFSPYPLSPLVVLLAEDEELCRELRKKGLPVQTFEALEKDHHSPVCVLPGKMLSEAYAFLGTAS